MTARKIIGGAAGTSLTMLNSCFFRVNDMWPVYIAMESETAHCAQNKLFKLLIYYCFFAHIGNTYFNVCNVFTPTRHFDSHLSRQNFHSYDYNYKHAWLSVEVVDGATGWLTASWYNSLSKFFRLQWVELNSENHSTFHVNTHVFGLVLFCIKITFSPTLDIKDSNLSSISMVSDGRLLFMGRAVKIESKMFYR